MNLIEKISIIIPVYNAEKFLEECIISVLNQTYDNFELLLIDDGSKDKSPMICDEYALKDNRIKVFHIQNGGSSNARNYGIKQANGNWIMFMDADDWIETDACEKLLHIATSNDLNCVYSSFYISYKNIEVLKGTDNETVSMINEMEKTARETLTLKNNISDRIPTVHFPWGKIIRRDLIIENNILFPVEIQPFEDIIFSARINLKSKKVAVYNRPLLHYRVYKNSMTNAKKDHFCNGLNTINVLKNDKELLSVLSDYDMQLFILRHIIHSKEYVVGICNYNIYAMIIYLKKYFDAGIYREFLDSIDIRFIDTESNSLYIKWIMYSLKKKNYCIVSILLIARKIVDGFARKEKKCQYWE